MKTFSHLFFLACTLVCCLLSSGCSGTCGGVQTGPVDIVSLAGGDNLTVNVTILHEDEIHTGWAPARICPGQAELYLKVHDESERDAFFLYPLNVGGEVSGSLTQNIGLPYTHSKSGTTMLVFEVLDDDGLSAEEERLLTTAFKEGANLLYVGGSIFALTMGPRKSAEEYAEIITFIQKNKDDAAKLGEVGAKLLIRAFNKHRFTSYGYREYVLRRNGPFVTPFTIVHPKTGIAVLDLKVITTDK